MVAGNPEASKISTSYVERQNLTMRMGMRRFTRLTNAFSKKVENHAHAVSLHFLHYNFARKHQTLKGATPAMAAGIERHPGRSRRSRSYSTVRVLHGKLRSVYATYDEFRDALFARHENRLTSVLSTVGDAIVLAPVPAGLVTRSVRVAVGVFVVGAAVIVGAHLFQPDTIKDEVLGVLRHPSWAVRAEVARVRAGSLGPKETRPISN